MDSREGKRGRCLHLLRDQQIHARFDCIFLFLFFFLSQEIYKDRKKFSRQVFEVASSDLVNMGITVVSYTLKDVRDDMVCLFVLFISYTCLF